MSMIGNFYRTDEISVKMVLISEISVSQLVYEDNSDESELMDIDKSWFALDFTLYGGIRVKKPKKSRLSRFLKKEPEPPENILSKVVMNENFISDEDMGYGPAMLVTKQDVHSVYDAIKNIDEEQFRKMFSMQEMLKENIYPLSKGVDEEEFFEYVFSNFESLKEFYRKASEEDQCVLFFIN